MATCIIRSLLARRKIGVATCLPVLNLMNLEERILLAVMPEEVGYMVTKREQSLGRPNSIWRVLSNVKLKCATKLTRMPTSV